LLPAAGNGTDLHELFEMSIGEAHGALITESSAAFEGDDSREERRELRELALVHALVALAAATMLQQRPPLPRPEVTR
jgi:hypothetical protein